MKEASVAQGASQAVMGASGRDAVSMMKFWPVKPGNVWRGKTGTTRSGGLGGLPGLSRCGQ